VAYLRNTGRTSRSDDAVLGEDGGLIRDDAGPRAPITILSPVLEHLKYC
jgi:hypothetical protein